MKEESSAIKKYKILQIPSVYLPKGGEFCRDQAVTLKKAGIDIDVLAHVILSWREFVPRYKEFPLEPFFSEEDGLTVYRSYFLKYPKHFKLSVLQWIKKTFKLFEKYVQQKGKPDLIHAHFCMWGGYVAYLIKQKYGIPYVITEHHSLLSYKSDYSKRAMKPWFDPYLKAAYSHADCILPVSYQLIEKINEYTEEKVPIKVLSNILDTNLFHLPKKEKRTDPVSAGKFVFFTANSYNPAKAYDILIEAFQTVYQKNPNVQLRIAGTNFCNKGFQRLLKQFPGSKNITFTGFLSPEEIRNELWKAHAYVLASRAESQSIAVLEALCTGLAVVCTEVVPEEVMVEGMGYRVPVDNPGELAAGMLKMVENFPSFDEKAISAHARSLVDPQKFTHETLHIYHKILPAD